jgi:hypothetical protein
MPSGIAGHGSPAFSQEGCVTAAAAPVVDTVQELRDYVGSIWHASDSTRLAVKKAELDRRTQRIAREYAAYNAQCEALDRAEWAQTQGGVYVPEHPVLNSLFPYNNYRANVEVNVGPNDGAPAPNVYYNPNTGQLFAPPQGPPNTPAVRQAPVQYAPAQYAHFQYGAVPNANANYAPVNVASSQFTPATPVGPAASAVPPVTQQQFGNGFVPAQAVAPGYGIFQQPAPQGDPPKHMALYFTKGYKYFKREGGDRMQGGRYANGGTGLRVGRHTVGGLLSEDNTWGLEPLYELQAHTW